MKIKLFLSILFSAAIFASSVYADEEITDRLQVVGKASIKALPENFLVSIWITENDPDYATTSKKLFAQSSTLQSELIKTGVTREIIKTSLYSINENYAYKNNERVKEGYQGQIRLTINNTYTPESMDKIIQVLLANQAIYTVSFTLSDKQKDALNEQAIKEAVADAKAKAELLEKQSGIKTDRITKVIYDYTGPDKDIMIRGITSTDSGSFSSSESVVFNPDYISIEKKVLIEWHIFNGKKNWPEKKLE